MTDSQHSSVEVDENDHPFDNVPQSPVSHASVEAGLEEDSELSTDLFVSSSAHTSAQSKSSDAQAPPLEDVVVTRTRMVVQEAILAQTASSSEQRRGRPGTPRSGVRLTIASPKPKAFLSPKTARSSPAASATRVDKFPRPGSGPGGLSIPRTASAVASPAPVRVRTREEILAAAGGRTLPDVLDYLPAEMTFTIHPAANVPAVRPLMAPLGHIVPMSPFSGELQPPAGELPAKARRSESYERGVSPRRFSIADADEDAIAAPGSSGSSIWPGAPVATADRYNVPLSVMNDVVPTPLGSVGRTTGGTGTGQDLRSDLVGRSAGEIAATSRGELQMLPSNNAMDVEAVLP